MQILPYVCLLLLVIFFLLLDKIFNKAIFKILPFILLGVFSGFRHNVGADYKSYERIFESIGKGIGNEENYVEIGYVLLIKIVDGISGTQQLLFLIFAIATQYLVYKYIRSYSYSFFISTIIFLTIGPFYLGSFNGVRQALSIAIFTVSFKYIIERNFAKFLLLVIVGSLIHKSILVVIPLYFILNKRISTIKMITILAFIFVAVKSGVFSYIIGLSFYSRHINEASNIDGANVEIILFILVSSILVILGKRMVFNNSENMFYNLNFISLCIMISSLITNEIADTMFLRFNNYFLISYVVLIPVIIEKLKGKLVLNYLLLLFCISFYFISIISGNSMVPYDINLKLFNVE